jgi:hypothetical protein
MNSRRLGALALVGICILTGIFAYLGLNFFIDPGIAQDNVPEPETSPEPEPEATSEPEPEATSEPEPEATSEPEPIIPAKPPKRKKPIVIGRSSSESSEESSESPPESPPDEEPPEEPPVFSAPESPFGTIMTLVTMASALVLFTRGKSILFR